MTIGIDFDGCLVSWNFPLVGKDIGSAEVCMVSCLQIKAISRKNFSIRFLRKASSW